MPSTSAPHHASPDPLRVLQMQHRRPGATVDLEHGFGSDCGRGHQNA